MIPRVREYNPTIKLLVRFEIEKDRKRLSTNVSKTSKAMIRVNTRNAPESTPRNGNRRFKKKRTTARSEVAEPGRTAPAEQIAGLDFAFFGGRQTAKILRGFNVEFRRNLVGPDEHLEHVEHLLITIWILRKI
jgi:hypothetical protein